MSYSRVQSSIVECIDDVYILYCKIGDICYRDIRTEHAHWNHLGSIHHQPYIIHGGGRRGGGKAGEEARHCVKKLRFVLIIWNETQTIYFSLMNSTLSKTFSKQNHLPAARLHIEMCLISSIDLYIQLVNLL